MFATPAGAPSAMRFAYHMLGIPQAGHSRYRRDMASATATYEPARPSVACSTTSSAGRKRLCQRTCGAPRATEEFALRLISEWASLHRSELEQNWRLAKAGQPLQQIAPLE